MYDDPTPPSEAWYNQSSFLHTLYLLGLIIFCSIIAYYLIKELINKESDKKSNSAYKAKLNEAYLLRVIFVLALATFVYLKFFITEYVNGIYCARVKYFNPNTGKKSNYKLSVEVEDNMITTIYFKNGGSLDNSHFTPTKIKSGKAEIVDDRDYEYTVSNLKNGECDD